MKYSSAKSSFRHNSSFCRSVCERWTSKGWEKCALVLTPAPFRIDSVQQQLNSSLDDETAAFLHDCYTLEEKERLKEEWRLFEEQKRNFERERKNFTEAAIRLGREVCTSVLFCALLIEHQCLDIFFPNPQKKAFQEDRASWLKNQFLNMTPFTDRRRCSSSDGQSALSISKSAPTRECVTGEGFVSLS